jgi:hypothetical protein
MDHLIVEMALAARYVVSKQLVAELKDKLERDGENRHSSGAKYGWALRCRKEIGNNI